jgi:hypothetical protein
MTVRFAIHNSTGDILRVGQCSESDIDIQAGLGESCVLLTDYMPVPNDIDHRIVNGQVVKIKLTDDQQRAKTLDEVRSQRAQLLSASDWTQLPDSPLSDEKKQLWKQYRQALRDMPAASDTIWPERPE